MWTRLELKDEYKNDVAEEFIMILYFERGEKDTLSLLLQYFDFYNITPFMISACEPPITNVQQYINFKGERCRVINDEEINNGINKYI